MKSKIVNFFLLSIILISFSCQSNEKREINKTIDVWMGKKVMIPRDIPFTVMGKDTSCPDLFNKTYKILLYVDSEGCTSCKLRLSDWKKMIFETDNLIPDQVSFLFIFKKGIDIIPLKELTSGVSDETVLEMANKQNRVLITFDSDFGELIFRQKLKAQGVILLKFTPKSTQQIVDTILNVLKTQAKIKGHFLIVKEKKIRVFSLK